MADTQPSSPANSASRAEGPARKSLRVLVASGIALAAIAIITAMVCRFVVSTTAEKYRNVTVLVDDNRKRCEEIASDVLTTWESAPVDPYLAITQYYLGPGRLKLVTAGLRTQQIREMLTKGTIEINGAQRDLVIEFHASVVKLCDLAASPAGYSRITFNERRSALRDQIATQQEKLRIALPVTGSEKGRILQLFDAPILAEVKRLEFERLAVEKRRLQVALAKDREQQAEQERAAAAATRAANEEDQRRRLVAAAQEETQDRLRPQVKKWHPEQTPELAERQRHLYQFRPQVKRWRDEQYPELLQLAAVERQVAHDLEASYEQGAAKCALLRDTAANLLGRHVYSAPTQEITAPAEMFLRNLRSAASRCEEQRADAERRQVVVPRPHLGLELEFLAAENAMKALSRELSAYGL